MFPDCTTVHDIRNLYAFGFLQENMKAFYKVSQPEKIEQGCARYSMLKLTVFFPK